MYNIWLVLAIAHYIWTMEEWWRWWAKARRERQEGYTKKRDGDIFQCQQAKGTFVGTTEPRECVIYVGEMSRAKVHFGNYNNNNIIIFLWPAFFIFVALCVMLSFSFFFVLLLALLARRHIERVCVCAQLTSAMHSPGLEGGGAFPALSSRVPWDVVASIEPTHKWMSKAGRS